MRRLVTSTTVDALSVADARAHLNITHSADDALIVSMVQAAIDAWEADTGFILGSSTWDEYFADWPPFRYHAAADRMDQWFRLSAYPLISISSIKYTDSNGVQATMSASDYVLSQMNRTPEVYLAHGAAWPAVTLQSGAPIVIRYVAGHAAKADIPKGALAAVKLRLGSLYELREDVATSDRGKVESAYIQGGWESFARRYRIEV